MVSIPVIALPEELNRLLVLLRDSANRGLKIETLIEIASASTNHAHIPSHQVTVEAAVGLGFVRGVGGRLLLNAKGIEFLKRNPEQTYELAPGQSDFLIRHCVLEGGYREDAKALLRMGHVDFHARRMWVDLQQLTGAQRERALLSFLRRVGFLVVRGSVAEVSPSYLQIAVHLLRGKRLSITELEAIIAERKKSAAEAERWVLEYERERLRKAGLPIEASAVAIISEIDVAAGYDIESFDGESQSLMPNRFIEVKSTTTDKIVFFWSSNELESARSLKERYWLYHLRNFGEGADCKLTVFRHPARLVTSGQLSLTPASYLVTYKRK